MTNVVLWAIIIFLIVVIIVLFIDFKRRREDRKQKFLFSSWPIKKVPIEEFDPSFKTGTLGPDHSTEIKFIATYRVTGGISDFESWILCNIAKRSNKIFEFGTCTGKTTYLLAANAPKDKETEIVTITLSPTEMDAYKDTAGDDSAAVDAAMQESVFTKFYYSETPEAKQIKQLFGDTKDFDEEPHKGLYDLIFVDASHAKSYVESDSRKAISMLKPGGYVFWHDYRGPRRAIGVFEALNELSNEMPLIHISGTSLVAYRKP
ncbi:MAG: class I SAM-dependent methyltransferase [Rhodospirillales bacterium]|nr:class I SAM-dependent methyltransferase [Rhodospirillales bacterium]